ncbi:MAG: F420-dependent methylenetetrahydromethanopterin dehydrogenase [Candidatus Bathyarchaeota archaeon]|nr:F420-dependent methylenetetrahydromethanopterin dehydrogenase [Candidatus Bathyarchaeota archaeon]
MSETVKVGVLKVGCIGTLPLLEFLLDERAERTDIDVKVVGSGANLGPKQCREATELMMTQKLDLVILIGPAQTAPGPMKARETLKAAEIPTIVISDSPAKKVVRSMEEAGLGYVIIEADSMIGARREFLDPAEMATYNSDVIRVLASTGAFNLVVEAIDRTIASIKAGEKPEPPKLIVDGKKAVEAASFSNPYAKAKALAAYELASQVSKVTTEACFKESDWKVYVPLVATAHEMMKAAAKMADEARELEKSGDTLLRRPHFKDGTLGRKKGLMEKPRRDK